MDVGKPISPTDFFVYSIRVEILDLFDDLSRLLLKIRADALWTSTDAITVMELLIATRWSPASGVSTCFH